MTGKTLSALTFLPCVVLLLFVTPTFGQEWTSANGKFKIEAEFVQLKDDKVQLKKNSGALVWVDLKKLSGADQKRARKLQKEAGKKAAELKKPDKDELLDQIELNCAAEIKKSLFNGENPQVVVSVVAMGPPAAEAMRYGKVKLTKFTDDTGGKLALEKDGFSMNDITKSFEKIDRESMFAEHPDDGVAVKLKLPSDVNPKMIGEVSGSFSILTGGKRSVGQVSDLSDHFGKKVVGDDLRKAKLRIEVEQPNSDDNGYGLSFNLSGNLKSLNRIWIGDANGERLEEQQGSSSSSFGKKANYSFFFTDDVSDTAVLFFETVDGAVELKIPFEFHDVEVVAGE